jgi:bile acid-coenzyme A ligase
MAQTVSERLADIAGHAGSDAAVMSFLPDGTPTVLRWAELDQRTQERARSFRQAARPLGGAAVICIAASRTPGTVVDILAAARAGMPIFPLDPSLPQHARALMLEQLTVNYGPTLQVRSNGLEPGRSDKSAVETVGYFLGTGGTTGKPKIVKHLGPLTYDPRLLPSRALRRARWQSGQRQLIVGPLYHAAPFTYCLTGLLDANTVIIPPNFEPAKIWHVIRSHGVQWLQLTPTHMARMLDSPSCSARHLKQLQGLLHAAAFCPHQIKRRWIEIAGPSRIFELYAATEDIGCTLASGEEWLARPGTVGRGVLTQIRILDEELSAQPAGSVGKVFMRGPRPLAGAPSYLGGISPHQAPGGFRSVGDYGWLDEDGYLFLKSRREDMITVAGKNVYPADIESVIAEHPVISDVTVFGIPDAVFGSRIAAVISTRDRQPLSVSDIVAYCRGRLAVHQLPQKIHHVAQLPRNEAGKIERWRLPSVFWQEEDQ